VNCKDCIGYKFCSVGRIREADFYDRENTVQYGRAEYLCPNFRNKADFVEVVRCRDCRHSVDDICKGLVYCNEHQKSMREKDFCSYGERKKDG
jgi:hypothetical protein